MRTLNPTMPIGIGDITTLKRVILQDMSRFSCLTGIDCFILFALSANGTYVLTEYRIYAFVTLPIVFIYSLHLRIEFSCKCRIAVLIIRA